MGLVRRCTDRFVELNQLPSHSTIQNTDRFIDPWLLLSSTVCWMLNFLMSNLVPLKILSSNYKLNGRRNLARLIPFVGCEFNWREMRKLTNSNEDKIVLSIYNIVYQILELHASIKLLNHLLINLPPHKAIDWTYFLNG